MWKIEHFSIPASLKCVVLVCGTNNMVDDKSEDIALGLIFCASRLRELHPQLHVFIAAILPRDLHITCRRAKTWQTNELLKSLCLRKPGISFIEESGVWVDDCGQLNEMLYHTDYLHLIKAGNEIFASQLVSAISPIIEGAPKVKKYRAKKRLPRVSLADTCTYRHMTPPSYLPPPPPISHPLQSPPCSSSSPLPLPSQTYSSTPKSPPTHSTPQHSPFTRTLSGKFLNKLYISLFFILLFFTLGVEGGGRDVNIYPHFLFSNDSVFIEGLGGGGGIFTGVTFDGNISFDKTFAFPNTSEFKIPSGF